MSDDSRDPTLPHHAHQARLAAAEALRRKAGWQPRPGQGGASHLEHLRAQERRHQGQQAYAEAAFCQPCALARAESGDDSALCQNHLAQALGLR